MSSATATVNSIKSKRRSGVTKNQSHMNRVIGLLMFIVFLVISCILLSAYSANLQHKINVLQKQNSCLEAEIDSIEAQIIEETKIATVEQVATEKLGMVRTDTENCITVSKDTDNKNGNLAATIREEAYN